MTGSRKVQLVIGAAAAAVVLTVIALAAIATHVTGIARAEEAAARPQCTPGAGGDTGQITQQVQEVLAGSPAPVSVPGLTAPKEQIPNARTIVATGITMGIPARGQIVALATALQESTLRNIDHGDRDSIGLFQQRPSQGWGTRDQILDPVYASTKFYNALKSLKDWESMPVTIAAQKVQKSAFPDAYARHEPLATTLQQAIAPALGGGLPAAASVGAGSSGCPSSNTDYGDIPAGSVPAGYRIPADTAPQARDAIRWALAQLGTPYQWGGTCTNPHGANPRDRCDCSSLMQRAYGVAGVSITRTTYTQIHDGRSVPSGTLRPGDLVFTVGTAARPEHVAMYLGDGLVVHAPKPGREVEVAELAGHGEVLLTRRIVG
ncbi:C40 family peptidase [Streptomyces anulatus]|uniref:C40 family peptidase n=1 Tax=Streptomyces anulatus TaxID=1892 RepID=UPI0034021EF0